MSDLTDDEINARIIKRSEHLVQPPKPTLEQQLAESREEVKRLREALDTIINAEQEDPTNECSFERNVARQALAREDE